MIYTILISIVFVAELIITITIIQNLLRLDKMVIETNDTITQSKNSIKDICKLSCKISEQWVILSGQWVEEIKQNGENILLKNLSKILLSFLLLKLNFKFINKIRKAKITKFLVKGYSFIENML